MLRLYDTLLSLPLFQGMSGGDVSEIVSRVRFGFERVPRKAVAIAEGSRCEALVLLLDGEMSVTTTAAGGAYSVTERLRAPQPIEPERLFGLSQHYARRYEALTLCHLLTVPKESVATLTERYIVFRLNFLNAVSTLAQRRWRTLLRPMPADLPTALGRWLSDRCSLPSGSKTFRVKQLCLAGELRVSRRDIAAALHTLEGRGLIAMGRGTVTVPDMAEMARRCL